MAASPLPHPAMCECWVWACARDGTGCSAGRGAWELGGPCFGRAFSQSIGCPSNIPPAPPPPLHHAFSSPPVLHIPRHSQEWGWGGRRGCRNWAWGRPRTRLPSRPVPHLHEHRRHVSFCMAAPGAACVCCNAPFQQEHSIRINSSGYGGWGGRLVSAPASTDPRAGLGKLGLPPWTSAARPRLCCPKSGT